jgi:hypothetical protein
VENGDLAGPAGGEFCHMLTIIESSDPLRDGLISGRYSWGKGVSRFDYGSAPAEGLSRANWGGRAWPIVRARFQLPRRAGPQIADWD